MVRIAARGSYQTHYNRFVHYLPMTSYSVLNQLVNVSLVSFHHIHASPLHILSSQTQDIS